MNLTVIIPDTADPGAIDQLERAVQRLGGQIQPAEPPVEEGMVPPQAAGAPEQVPGARANRPPVPGPPRG